jgi:hypothetical protein
MKGRGGGPAWYLWLVLAVTSVAGPAVAVKVSGDRTDRAVAAARAAQRESQRESELVWCRVITVLLSPNSPPTTQRGKEIAEGIAAVRMKYRCPPG